MSKFAETMKTADTKFAKVLKDAKIDPVRVLAKSHELETLRREDREIKRIKRAAAGKEDDASKEARAKKPRSGRGATVRSVTAALVGKSVSGPTKHRLLRAVNALLSQKKKPETNLKALF